MISCIRMGAIGRNGAGEETRTLDINLGKVALYQLSYARSVLLFIHSQLRQNFGIPARARTATKGFGDPYATITPRR